MQYLINSQPKTNTNNLYSPLIMPLIGLSEII